MPPTIAKIKEIAKIDFDSLIRLILYPIAI